MISYEFEHAVGDYVELIDDKKTGPIWLKTEDKEHHPRTLVGRVKQVAHNLCGNFSYLVVFMDCGTQKVADLSASELKAYTHENDTEKDG